MRRFLTTLICLSTLAMVQNVIAAAPAASSVPGADGLVAVEYAEASAVGSLAGESLVVSPAAPDRDLPTSGTMMLLVAGLAGLTAVGARTDGRSARPSS